MWSIYGFCLRSRHDGLRSVLHIWVLGPFRVPSTFLYPSDMGSLSRAVLTTSA